MGPRRTRLQVCHRLLPDAAQHLTNTAHRSSRDGGLSPHRRAIGVRIVAVSEDGLAGDQGSSGDGGYHQRADGDHAALHFGESRGLMSPAMRVTSQRPMTAVCIAANRRGTGKGPLAMASTAHAICTTLSTKKKTPYSHHAETCSETTARWMSPAPSDAHAAHHRITTPPRIPWPQAPTEDADDADRQQSGSRLDSTSRT